MVIKIDGYCGDVQVLILLAFIFIIFLKGYEDSLSSTAACPCLDSQAH